MTYTLLAINVAVFGICAAQASSTDIASTLPPLFDRWALSGLDLSREEYWRLLTAGFLHLSLFHLAVNMVSLYLLGRSLEPALGSSQYTMVYLTALFGGSAAVALLGDPLVITAGASGAIYGLMGALLVFVLRARTSVAPVVGIIVVNIVLSVTLPGISILAHLGGLLFGAASAAVFVFVPGWCAPRARLDAVGYEQRKRLISRAIRITWGVATIVFAVAVLLGVVGETMPRVDLPLR